MESVLADDLDVRGSDVTIRLSASDVEPFTSLLHDDDIVTVLQLDLSFVHDVVVVDTVSNLVLLQISILSVCRGSSSRRVFSVVLCLGRFTREEGHCLIGFLVHFLGGSSQGAG